MYLEIKSKKKVFVLRPVNVRPWIWNHEKPAAVLFQTTFFLAP